VSPEISGKFPERFYRKFLTTIQTFQVTVRLLTTTLFSICSVYFIFFCTHACFFRDPHWFPAFKSKIRENFLKFPSNVKFSENLQPYRLLPLLLPHHRPLVNQVSLISKRVCTAYWAKYTNTHWQASVQGFTGKNFDEGARWQTQCALMFIAQPRPRAVCAAIISCS